MSEPGFEQRLRQAIKSAIKSGATLNGIAVASGVPQPVVYRFHHKQQTLKLPTAERLAEYFGITTSLPSRNVARISE